MGPLRAGGEQTPRGVEDFSAAVLSPRGAWLIYRVALDDGRHMPVLASYQLKELSTGTVRTLPGSAYLLEPRDELAQPSWSPDGDKVAYLTQEESAWRLNIWDARQTKHLRVDDRAACGRQPRGRVRGCSGNSLAWSPDSRVVYFLAEATDAEIASRGTADTSAKQESARGVLVLTTSTERGSDAAQAHIPGQRVDVLALNIDGRSLTTVETRDHGGIRISTSPDGRMLLITERAATEGPFAQPRIAPTIVSLRAKRRTRSADLADSKAEGNTKIPLPLLRTSSHGSWSPDSRRIAFIEKGALTDGDILLYDVATGRLDKLTRELVLEGTTPQAGQPPAARDTAYPGTKFGSSPFLPLWSDDGAGVVVARRAQVDSIWRLQLWHVSSTSGTAKNLSDDLPCDFFQRPSLLKRPAAGLIAVARCDGSATRLFRFNLQDGSVAQLAELAGAEPRLVSVTSDAVVAFVHETAAQPPEIVAFSSANGGIRPLSDANASVAHVQNRYRNLKWRSYDERLRAGRLYLPLASQSDGRLPPLILQIYPLDAELVGTAFDEQRYVSADLDLLYPLADLLRDGYAVLKPEFPTAGSGKTCERLAADVRSALEMLKETRQVDTERVGIIGHSFGGWSVNCLVTRIPTLAAAVSVAGISDLVTKQFTLTGADIGGGQARIGKGVWDAPNLYWQESPLLGLPQVQTPLLLIHGKRDTQVSYEQSVYMFVGLQRLGKVATLVGYDEADHASVLWHPDFGPRVASWFNNYLRPEARLTHAKLTQHRSSGLQEELQLKSTEVNGSE